MMTFKFVHLCCSLCCAGAVYFSAGASASMPAPDAQDAGAPSVDAALVFAADKKYDAALAMLELIDNPQSYEARFARARILAWSGDHEAAAAVYKRLLLDHPGDPDIQLGHAQLAYYRGEFGTAETRFQTIASVYPDYKDAQDGMKRARIARQSAARDGVAADGGWRLDTGVEISAFERSLNDNWTSFFAQAARTSAQRAYIFRMEHHRRFDLDDTTLAAGISTTLGHGWDGALHLEATPNADFRPRYGVDVELGKTFAMAAEWAPSLRPFVRYSYDNYAVQPIHTVFPGVQAFWTNGVSLDARIITVLQRAENTQVGGLVRMTVPVNNDLRITAGAADSPEAINGVVVRTRSVFGGVQYDLSKQLSVRVDYARDDRENSYIRNAYSVSLTHRF